MGMGTDKWEWEGIRILIVFPHTSIILTVSNELISYTQDMSFPPQTAYTPTNFTSRTFSSMLIGFFCIAVFCTSYVHLLVFISMLYGYIILTIQFAFTADYIERVNGTVRCVAECNVNCHKKCQNFIPNLCGVNQKILAEQLTSIRLSQKSQEPEVFARYGFCLKPIQSCLSFTFLVTVKRLRQILNLFLYEFLYSTYCEIPRERVPPELLRGVFTTRRYTNARLPYLTYSRTH